ncbi:hypothetical protein HMPREF9466_00181 [Fusobacterium necrophorum subsp. funduliforme 1_1_36S]|nr:hypothetical protein HMPREF9466_00181 [Fusobacterium necrophorum subsp. funduliforme 1_1_36S]
MKHYLRNIMLIGGIVFQTALCDAATNFEVEENMKKEIQVTAANTYKFEKQEGNSAVKAKNFVIKKEQNSERKERELKKQKMSEPFMWKEIDSVQKWKLWKVQKLL